MSDDNGEVIDGTRCGAKTKSGGKCTRPIPKFGKRCRHHGGASPWAKQKTEERRIQADAERAIQKLNITPVSDPLTALRTVAGEVLAWKDEISRHVSELTQVRYRSDGGEQIRAEIALYERAIDRCVHTLAIIAKLNIDERLAAIEEKQAEMLETALFAAFDAAGYGITETRARQAIAKEFVSHLKITG